MIILAGQCQLYCIDTAASRRAYHSTFPNFAFHEISVVVGISIAFESFPNLRYDVIRIMVKAQENASVTIQFLR
jgi:hypothetical protein